MIHIDYWIRSSTQKNAVLGAFEGFRLTKRLVKGEYVIRITPPRRISYEVIDRILTYPPLYTGRRFVFTGWNGSLLIYFTEIY